MTRRGESAALATRAPEGEKIMNGSKTFRHVVVFLAAAVWVFFLLSLGSFHFDDWPTHQVYPHHATSQNLCGRAGALVAYGFFFAIGQGAFPVLFFSGLCLALYAFQNR